MGSTRPETMRSGTRQPGPGHDAIASVSTRRSTTRPPTKPTPNGDNSTRQQPETNHQPLPEKPTSLQTRILLLRSRRIVRSVRAPLRTSGPRTESITFVSRTYVIFGSTSSRSMRRGSAWGSTGPTSSTPERTGCGSARRSTRPRRRGAPAMRTVSWRMTRTP